MFCPPPHARPPPYQACNPLIWDLRNPLLQPGLWPPARRSLMSYITLPVRLSALIYQLGVMRLSDIVSGMFAAIARSNRIAKDACLTSPRLLMAGELRGGRGRAHGRDEGDLPSADHLRLALSVRLALTHTPPFPLLLSASHQHLRCLPLTRCGLGCQLFVQL